MMQSKREMLIVKNLESAEVVDKLEMNLPFVLRKGRKMMATMCKDKNVKTFLDKALRCCWSD